MFSLKASTGIFVFFIALSFVVHGQAQTPPLHPRLLFSQEDSAALKQRAASPVLKPTAKGLLERAEWQLKAAEASIRELKVRLESQRLDQVSNLAKVQSEFTQAKLQADRDEALIKLGLKGDLEYKLTKGKADEIGGRT